MPDLPSVPRHLVICSHPSPHGFGHKVLDTYVRTVEAQGQDVTVRDLYAMGFDPVLRLEEHPRAGPWLPSPDVAAECDLIRPASIVVLIYPIWYGLPPAMLKGYVERVLGAGLSYGQLHDRIGQPFLIGKSLLSFSTSALPLAWLDQQGQLFALREIFDVYLWRGFGMARSEHIMLDGIIPGMSSHEAEGHLRQVRETAEQTCARLAGFPPASVPFEA